MARQAVVRLQEREVEVYREKLIATLQENREKHVAAYREAINGYRAAAARRLEEDGRKAKERLDKQLRKIASDIETFDPDKPHDFDDHFVLVQQIVMTLPVPRCYAAEYDAAIDIAKWDVNETMKLSYAEFNCFVRDKWDWSMQFETLYDSYTST